MGKIFKALEKSQEDIADISVSHGSVFHGSSREKEIFLNKEKSSSESFQESEIFQKNDSLEQDKLDQNDQKYSPEDDNKVFSGSLDNSIVIHSKPHSIEAEQFRILKNSILFPDNGNPPRSIMVTSTAPGEGKSFVAANLAVSIAKSIDEYVLLMDCDLRMPSIHLKFGYSDSDLPGLSEYLSEAKPLSSILKRTAIDKLSFLPAGKPPDNPSELISSDQMKNLLNEVKARYEDRYIIIDSPPPYLTSEANALARQVDAIVIVVKTGKTKKGDLQDLIDTYGRKKILGVVKNFADQHKRYGNKSSYGYK